MKYLVFLTYFLFSFFYCNQLSAVVVPDKTDKIENLKKDSPSSFILEKNERREFKNKKKRKRKWLKNFFKKEFRKNKTYTNKEKWYRISIRIFLICIPIAVPTLFLAVLNSSNIFLLALFSLSFYLGFFALISAIIAAISVSRERKLKKESD